MAADLGYASASNQDIAKKLNVDLHLPIGREKHNIDFYLMVGHSLVCLGNKATKGMFIIKIAIMIVRAD